MTLAPARDIGAEVWGQGFPSPLFEGEFGVLQQRLVGGKHMRLDLAASGARFEAIAFDEAGPLPELIRATYRPEVNLYQDLESLQLIIDSWRPL